MNPSEKDIFECFGKPHSVYRYYEPVYWYWYVTTFEYSFGTVRLDPFDDGIAITVRDDSIFGPRGTKVGDHMDDILYKFPYREEAEIPDDGTEYLYYKQLNEDYAAYGAIWRDESGEVDYISFMNMRHGLGYTIENGIVTELYTWVWEGFG
jgi:hypothetical protein